MKPFYLRSLVALIMSTAILTSAAHFPDSRFEIFETTMPTGTITGAGNYCLNEPGVDVVFTGSGEAGTGVYTFNYEVGGTVTNISTDPGSSVARVPYNTSSLGTSIYRLISVSYDGGPAIPVNNQSGIFRTVPAPTVNFDFTDNLCSGTPVAFTNNSTMGSGITYLWDFGDGATSTDANPVHTYDATGCSTSIFTVRLQVNRNGCIVTSSRSINIKQEPNLTLSDVNGFTPFNNCGRTGDYVLEVEDQTTDLCVANKRIDWGDGTPSEPINGRLTHTYTTKGTFDLTFTGDADNGCVAERIYVVANVSNPQGGLTSPGGTLNRCITETDPIQFSITNWGGNSSDTTYSIDYGDDSPELILTQQQLEASSSFNPADPQSSAPYFVPYVYTESNCPDPFYTVTLRVENACAVTRATVDNIVILSPPEAEFETVETACVNTSVLFRNLTDAGFSDNCSTDAIFEWDFGDGTPVERVGPSQVADISHIFTTPGDYLVTLSARGACGTDTFEQRICIEPVLVPAISYSTDEGCTDLDVEVTNTTDLTDFCDNLTYNWTVVYTADFCETGPGDFSYTNATTENSLAPEFNFVQPGRYTIGGTITGSSCGTVAIPEQEILIKQPPRVVIDPIVDLCESDGLSINPSATVESCTVAGSTLNYAWSFPGATPSTATTANPGSITYPAQGDYTVSLTVTNECGTSTATDVIFTISEDPVITGNLTECEGETEQLTATGTPAAAGAWATADTTIATVDNTGLINAVSPGIVDITFTNANGCSATVAFEVTSGPTFTSQPLANQEICQGGTTSLLTTTFTNGNGTVSYQWYSNTTNRITGGAPITGATTDTFQPDAVTVGEQFYYVIISFTVGCPTITSDIARVQVSPPPSIISQPLATQEICVGGTIDPLTLTIQDGAGTPTYQWYSNTTNSNAGGTAISGATNISYTPAAYAAPGTYYYYVEVNFSSSGCGNLLSEVAQVIVADDPTIDVQPLVTQEICQTTAAATLSVAASGGSGTLSYQWFQNTTNATTGGTAIIGETSDSYQPVTDTMGTRYYYVMVSQPGLDCQAVSSTATVTVVPAPTIVSQPQSADYCESDAIAALSVTATNGSGVPSYQWYQNTTNSTLNGTVLTGETNSSFDPPAIVGDSYYYVEVTYATGGCSLVISEVATVTIARAPTVADETITVCSGDAFSYIPDSTSPNTNTATTTYTWSISSSNPAGVVTGATAQTTAQLSLDQQLINTTGNAATVVYTVTPTTGSCLGTPFELTVEVLPKPIVVFSETDQIICNNTSSIAVNLSSNFANNVSYEWTATVPVGITGATASGTNVIPAQTLTNSTAAALTVTYFAKAIFLNGTSSCEGDELQYSITVQPAILAAGVTSSFNGFGVSASGATDGTIDLSVSGGSGSYTFSWTGPGGYTAIAEDITGLAAGNYQVSIDDGLCAPVVLNFLITSPPELIAEEDLAAHRDLDCFGDTDGVLAVQITQESVGPYDYELIDENGAVIFSVLDSNVLRQEFNGLTAQVYSVRITDGNGASKVVNDLEILQPDEILINPAITPISCYLANDASINLTVTGGSGGYVVSWSNLASGFSQDNLAADTYVITVTDSRGCTAVISVEIEEAPVFFAAPTFSNISCFGANDGSIQLNLTGGVAPVTLTWSDGSTQGTTRNNLSAGTYTATIRESSNGSCVITETFIIIEPQALVLDDNTTDVLDCNRPSAGAIDLLVSGGTAPFTYLWNNGETTEDLTGITAGTYQVTVTDANNCTAQRSITVFGTAPIVLNIDDRLDVNCDTGMISQVLTASTTGGLAPYTYSWSSGTVSGTNGRTATTTDNGLIIVTVTDALGCSRDESFDVDINTLGDPFFSTDSFAFATYGDYSIQDPIQFTDGSTGNPLSVSWDFGDGSFSDEPNPIHSYTTPGQYTVIQSVNYEYGCQRMYIVTLNVTKGYKLVMPNAFTPNADKLNDVFRPVQQGLEQLKFSIYDSWGSLIYSEEGATIAGWDGQMNNRNAENGNFYYKFAALTFYGSEIVAEGTFTKID